MKDPFKVFLDKAVDYVYKRNQNEAEIAHSRDINVILTYLMNLSHHSLLQFCPYQVSKFDLTLKMTALSSNQDKQSGVERTLQNNFYYASPKKGGPQANVPLVIAKIHESLMTLIAGKSEAQDSKQ